MRFRKLFPTTVRLVGLAACWFLSVSAIAGDFTLAVVGSFGEKLGRCSVDTFRLVGVAGSVLEYRDRFDGLFARNLPDGEYEVSVICVGGTVKGKVEVNDFNRFGLIEQNRRTTRSDHVVPRLVIRMVNGLHDGEIWWVSLTSVYGKVSYADQFRDAEAAADIFDPDPGSYTVAVRSTGGYACVQEIDLFEITRLWTFDPRGCKFDVDRFAHVVTGEDRRSGKKSGWYQDMRTHDEELFRELEKATDKR